MYDKLVQEYRIWLEELLEVLHEFCEDVVPAGRFDEGIYWRTKELYGMTRCVDDSGKAMMEILQYAKEGRILLEEAVYACQGEAIAEEREEIIIHLRRKYANAILNSLQMFVNFVFLARLDFQYECICKYFETDTSDKVIRIRSGVAVKQEGELAKTYLFQSLRKIS